MKQTSNNFDYVVVGAGPGGIFFAYEMMEKNPNKKILLIERGKSVKDRSCPEAKAGKCLKCKPFCSITAGFSGAGAFSDGKCNLFNEDDEDFEIGGNLHKYIGVPETKEVIRYTDEIHLKFGATPTLEGVSFPAEIAKIRKKAQSVGLQLANVPIRHLGTDKARELYQKLEEYLEEKGVTIYLETEVTDLIIENGRAVGVKYSKNGSSKEGYAFSDKVVLAVGRAGADWLEAMCKKHKIDSRPAVIDIGVRYELPDNVMTDINKYLYEGKFIGRPNPFNDKVRTFCQNPSGFVSAENYKNGLTLANGHSAKGKKSNNTNLALLVSVDLEDIEAPMEYSRNIGRNINALAKGNVMVQRLGDVKSGKATMKEDMLANNVVPTLKSAVPGNICLAMPHNVMVDLVNFIEMMEKVAPGFAGEDNLLYAPEMKFYSNKVTLNKHLETSIKGLYAIGDGCGLTRGLMMASASGVHLARVIDK